jgi:membrane protein DedA with SNARE-associated domain
LIVAPSTGCEQANEIHRIVPHAILATSAQREETVRFLHDAEAQKDSARFHPTPERVSASVNGKPASRLELAGWSLVLVLALIAMCTLVSEDLTCVGVGLLVSNGAIGFWQGCLGCYVGFLFGDLLIYWLGRAFGEVLIKNRPFRWFLSEKAVLQSEAWFERRGVWVLFASRFMPGTRVPVYFAAGILKASWWSVIWTLSVASLIWIPGLVWISTVVGDSVIRFFEQSQFWTLAGIVVVSLFIFWLTHMLVPLLTFRGRRLAYSRWMRWSHWEFWPPAIVYLPIYVYILFQALKRRSLSVAMLANPMLPCGGLVGESKGDILEKLRSAGAPVAPFLRLTPNAPAEVLREEIRNFIDQNQYPSFPVVLKPESGQRGYGVQILRDERELMAALGAIDEPYLLQRYIAGLEFGVFYHRMPGASGGKISSINRKSYLSLTGDGKHFIETLILKDPRAVCSAPTLLLQHAHQLYRIPADGERVPLVELGSHARGCLFLDGRDLITDALVAALDRICLPVEGFFYGRFDLKCPSEQDFKQGNQLTILELNLLTSEPTHIYDPRFGLIHAWQTLAAHWRIAYKIGEANRASGLKPIGWVALMLRIANHYR